MYQKSLKVRYITFCSPWPLSSRKFGCILTKWLGWHINFSPFLLKISPPLKMFSAFLSSRKSLNINKFIVLPHQGGKTKPIILMLPLSYSFSSKYFILVTSSSCFSEDFSLVDDRGNIFGEISDYAFGFSFISSIYFLIVFYFSCSWFSYSSIVGNFLVGNNIFAIKGVLSKYES